jgi:hypothetical protein
MGAKNSKPANKEEEKDDDDIKNMKFENVISYIAAKYITKANFQDLKNLHDPKYCNKLVILTSKAIKHFLNDMEIQYMDQKTQGGVEINKMAKSSILYLDKENLDRLDISSQVKKKRMCIGIAKFYVKIAHLFAAIAMTINPRFTYTDTETGQDITISLQERGNIPNNLKIKHTYDNLCLRRINALKPIQNTTNGIFIKSKNCNMNMKETSSIGGVEVPISSTETKNLYDEIGIPELMNLYLDDYNFNTGKYIGMTTQAKQSYINDLEKFYIAFTGGQCFPNKCGIIVNLTENIDKNIIIKHFQKYGKIIYFQILNNSAYIKFKDVKSRDKSLGDTTFNTIKWEINTFSDIPLKDFHNQDLCKNPNSLWLKSYKGSSNDALFKQYAQHLQSMIHKSQKIEKSLLSILKQLFSFWIDPQKKEKILTINPKLDNNLLQSLTEKARDSILKLYIGCEEDFQKGLQLFEAIIKSKMIETANRKITSFEKKADEL